MIEYILEILFKTDFATSFSHFGSVDEKSSKNFQQDTFAISLLTKLQGPNL